MLIVTLLTLSLVAARGSGDQVARRATCRLTEQAERDGAAARLREIFEPSPRKTWGAAARNAEARTDERTKCSRSYSRSSVSPKAAFPDPAARTWKSIDSITSWHLRGRFSTIGDVLSEATLEPRMQHVLDRPRRGFFGRMGDLLRQRSAKSRDRISKRQVPR